MRLPNSIIYNRSSEIDNSWFRKQRAKDITFLKDIKIIKSLIIGV